MSPPCTPAGRWGVPSGRVPPESLPRGCQAEGGLPTPPLGFAGLARAQVRPAGPLSCWAHMAPSKPPREEGSTWFGRRPLSCGVRNESSEQHSPGPSLGHRPSPSEPRLRSLSLAAWAHERKAETPPGRTEPSPLRAPCTALPGQAPASACPRSSQGLGPRRSLLLPGPCLPGGTGTRPAAGYTCPRPLAAGRSPRRVCQHSPQCQQSDNPLKQAPAQQAVPPLPREGAGLRAAWALGEPHRDCPAGRGTPRDPKLARTGSAASAAPLPGGLRPSQREQSLPAWGLHDFNCADGPPLGSTLSPPTPPGVPRMGSGTG